MLARAIDGEALLIQQMLDLQQQLDVLAPVQSVTGAGFFGTQRRKFRLPVAEHVSFEPEHSADFADSKEELIGNLWGIRTGCCFRHPSRHATRWQRKASTSP